LAQDIVVLDMGRVSNLTDFFIVLSGNSTRQVKAISDYVVERLKKLGHKVWHTEGYQHALWVLLDYGDIVIHVFHTPTRKFYDLERLWADVAQIKIED